MDGVGGGGRSRQLRAIRCMWCCIRPWIKWWPMGLIPRNATDALKVPRIERAEIIALTAEEANRLIEAARESEDRLQALYVLAVHTRPRQGDLLALTRDDLNLEAGTLRVRRTLTRARAAGTRFHDLRHTCATLLLSRNINPKVVAEMLGHANIAITLDTYSHVLPDMQEKVAKALEEALR